MAAPASIDAIEWLRKQIEESAPDPLKTMLVEMVNLLMSAEVDAMCGAGYRERTGERANSRNGYRERPWDTRVGTIGLQIPKLRHGSYFPAWLLEPRRRAEKALTAVVAEAYLLGVSTRKLEDLVQALGIEKLSKSQVSELAKELDGVVKSFRERPLSGPYKYVWLDALFVKCREDGRIANVACLVAVGVNAHGRREISSASASIFAAAAKRGWSCSTVRLCCAFTDSASGWAKMVRTNVATSPCAALGTFVSRLRMKCVRQRCQAAPRRTEAMASLRPGCASEITSSTPFSPRARRLRRNASQPAPSSSATTSRPRISRRPSPFTPTPTRQATFTMRPFSRHFTKSASSQTYLYGPVNGRSRKLFTTPSSSFANSDTWLFESRSMPSVCTRSSTFLVETPSRYASATTAVSAFSARRRGSSSQLGK